MYSPSINNLIKTFSRLPTVGQKTAERFVFYLLKSGKKEVGELTLSLKTLTDKVKSCANCWDFSDTNPCSICIDTKRDQTILCVVSQPQDIQVIEKTGEFKGLYFVLRGLIRADEANLAEIKIKELFTKIKKTKTITEIIIALNADLAGETTAMYLDQALKKINPKLKVTRLARGLPMGSDLQYADEITLGAALKNRR